MQLLATWFTVEKDQKSKCGRDVRKGQNFKLLDVSKDEKSIKVSISGHPDDAVIVSADCVATLAVLPGTMKDDKAANHANDFSVKKEETVRVYRVSSDRSQLVIGTSTSDTSRKHCEARIRHRSIGNLTTLGKSYGGLEDHRPLSSGKRHTESIKMSNGPRPSGQSIRYKHGMLTER
ncbi:hypothetical protein BDY17DRAFT_290386 [Neohortaea acidophila]|uniref:Uncharacterized protein n=1 Tax=Neohortaea acidophila TaxID=245834 RepID=A0A6A6Q7B8_9PEZI|nr:uncharacterized protein BDY17DRAFT_290386 [Neohortaea acidophila]KAF2488192.1 hypothetical protein BDY17DRAFT_290386 [Neohortaea acidophila]